MKLKRSMKRSLLWCGSLALFTLFLGKEASAQPRAFFQFATSQGLDNRMNLNRVPVRAANGSIKYFDVALTFAVDAAGRTGQSITIHNFGDDNRVDTSAVFIFCSSCS